MNGNIELVFKIGDQMVSVDDLVRVGPRINVMLPTVSPDGSASCEQYIGPEPNPKVIQARNAIAKITRCRYHGPVSMLDFEKCNGPVFWYTSDIGGGVIQKGIAEPLIINELKLSSDEVYIYVFSTNEVSKEKVLELFNKVNKK